MNNLTYSPYIPESCQFSLLDGQHIGSITVGQDADTVNKAVKKGSYIIHSIANPESRFLSLTSEWEKDTFLSSSVTEICSHPAYQQIIEMGNSVLPFIFRELSKRPGHWFCALKSITGKDPVPNEKKGQMKEMATIWLRWWIKNRQKYRFPLSCSVLWKK